MDMFRGVHYGASALGFGRVSALEDSFNEFCRFIVRAV